MAKNGQKVQKYSKCNYVIYEWPPLDMLEEEVFAIAFDQGKQDVIFHVINNGDKSTSLRVPHCAWEPGIGRGVAYVLLRRKGFGKNDTF